MDAALPYLAKAAEMGDLTACFNLGVLAQQRQGYKHAVDCFASVLERAPDYHVARLELARHVMHGWAIEKDEKRAFRMMQEVAEKGDPELAATAWANLGIFHKNGMGTEQSLPEARRCLEKAVKGGVPEAPAILKNLGSD